MLYVRRVFAFLLVEGAVLVLMIVVLDNTVQEESARTAAKFSNVIQV